MLLDRNPLEGDPLKIAEIKAMETIKEGKTVYRHPAAEKTVALQSCAESEACIKVATLSLNMAGVIDIHRHDKH